MSVVYSTTVKNARLQQVINNIDAGSANGVLVIGTSALSGATGVIATITLNKASFAAPSGGAMSLAGTPLSNTNALAGSAAKAEFRDSTGLVVVSGLSVGTSGSDINLNSVTISAGQTVTCNSGTITHG